MLSFEIINICFIVASFFNLYIKAECTIDVLSDPPIFSKTLGSKTIILPNGQKSLTLKSGETIRANCSRQISIKDGIGFNDLIQKNELVSSVKLKCDSTRGADKFSYQKLDPPSYLFNNLQYSAIYLQCVQVKLQLYESNMTLPNCQTYSSYVIGMQSPLLGSYIAAYVCFDIDGLNTKYIKYLANRGEHELRNEKPMLQTVFSKPIDSFGALFESTASLEVLTKSFKESNPSINIHDFDYLSLVQDLTISTELRDFDYMFKVIWWRSLRLGSWQYFFEALKARSEIGKYFIYTGTSGVMSIPLTSSCEIFEKFIVEYEGRKVSAPELIWAYLKPVKENKTDEFVIIAHNTPFYSAENATSSCSDVCHEINWLNGSVFKKFHLLPAFGVVECCRAIGVGTKLEGFPVEIINENEKN